MMFINLLPKEEPPTESTKQPTLLLPDFGYRHDKKYGNVLKPTKFNNKLAHLHKLKEEIKALTPRWHKSRKLFKEIDWRLGQLICEQQDLDREIFTKTIGITVVTPKVFKMKKARRPKKQSFEEIVGMTDSMSKKDALELYKKLEAKFGED